MEPLIETYEHPDEPMSGVAFFFYRGTAYHKANADHGGSSFHDIQDLGLVSLYLGTAYKMLAQNAEGKPREMYMEQAAFYAEKARHNLELTDVPIMWALAMFLTSDVFAMTQELAEPNTMKVFRELSKRTRELGAQYH